MKNVKEMKWFYWLVCNALIAFLDFSAGVFIVHFISLIADYQPAVLTFVIGGVLAISPDFDVVYMYIKKGRIYSDHHQFLSHRPIIGLAIAHVLGWLFGGSFWGTTALACLLWHYLHDTEGFGTGGGIAWLWPFSRLYYSPWRVMSPEKSPMAENPEEWFAKTWLVPNPTVVAEILTGSIFLLAVAVAAGSWRVGMFFVILVWLGAFLLWSQPSEKQMD